jgi:hypothetical protein
MLRQYTVQKIQINYMLTLLHTVVQIIHLEIITSTAQQSEIHSSLININKLQYPGTVIATISIIPPGTRVFCRMFYCDLI